VKALLVLALVGCGSYSTYKTTRIVPDGQTEWLFGTQVAGASLPGNAERGTVAPMPETSAGVRRGFANRYEVQVNTTLAVLEQVKTGSVELAGKIRVAEHGRYSLAVGAATGYRYMESSGAVIEGGHAVVPVIFGIDIRRNQLVFAVTGGYQRYYESGAHPVGVPFLGDSIGFLYQISDHWGVMHEAGFAYTPTDNFMTESSRLFHMGIALTWTR
jgi:hypothetical protein